MRSIQQGERVGSLFRKWESGLIKHDSRFRVNLISISLASSHTMADCYIKRSVQSLTVANSPPPPLWKRNRRVRIDRNFLLNGGKNGKTSDLEVFFFSPPSNNSNYPDHCPSVPRDFPWTTRHARGMPDNFPPTAFHRSPPFLFFLKFEELWTETDRGKEKGKNYSSLFHLRKLDD